MKWAVVALMALASGVGTSSAGPTPDPDSVPLGSASGYDSRISGLITVGDGIQIQKSYQDVDGEVCRDPRNQILDRYAARSSSPFCFEQLKTKRAGRTTRVVFYYYISTSQRTDGQWDDKGRDTEYYVDLSAKVPSVGANEVNCLIRKKGSNEDVTLSSPYTCDVSWADPDPHSVDPQPHWSIRAKTTEVIDAKTAAPALLDKARDAILDTCGKGKPQCTYDDTNPKGGEIVAQPQSEWTAFGDSHTNVDDQPRSYSVKHGVKFGWNVQWKVSLGVDLGFLERVLAVKISGEYGQSYSQDEDWSSEHSVTIPPHHVGGFRAQQGQLKLTGNFQIVYPDRVLEVRNYTVVWALKKSYNPPGPQPPIQPLLVIPYWYPCAPDFTECFPPKGNTENGDAPRPPTLTRGELPEGVEFGPPQIAWK